MYVHYHFSRNHLKKLADKTRFGSCQTSFINCIWISIIPHGQNPETLCREEADMIRILGHHALLGVRSRGDYIRFPYFTFPPPVYFSGEEDNAVHLLIPSLVIHLHPTVLLDVLLLMEWTGIGKEMLHNICLLRRRGSALVTNVWWWLQHSNLIAIDCAICD